MPTNISTPEATTMHLFSSILASLSLTTTAFSYPTTKTLHSLLNATHLLHKSQDDSNAHPFCVPPQGFTTGYEHCTFASAVLSESLNPSHNGTLANAWIFDQLCNVLGVVQNLGTNTLPGGVYNFDKSQTKLQDATVVGFGDGRLGLRSPSVNFAGKSFQGDGNSCWWMDPSDGGSIWGSMVFGMIFYLLLNMKDGDMMATAPVAAMTRFTNVLVAFETFCGEDFSLRFIQFTSTISQHFQSQITTKSPSIPNSGTSKKPPHKASRHDVYIIWLALALISSTSASGPVLGLHNLCTLPRFFEQYHNSTCTVSYFLEQNLNVAELWAFDCNCTQVAHAYPVPIGSGYNFQTDFTFQPSLEHNLTITFPNLIDPPRYSYAENSYIGREEGYRTTCANVTDLVGKICELRFSCEWMGVPILPVETMIICPWDKEEGKFDCHDGR
ncbi:uncharacterized protein PAC_07008 [Phialocephala subalpina]|uniref:Uncharacterized protein n=1 Tax=Phialocephala subalpina TaxID=576137 RepID=A0A1L7WWH8_9HELO|nr:uncharacterized protein PAC_07008 [Phialocephala subalpina]